MDNKIEKCPPCADSLVTAMRAFGYDLSMALCDIIDNSITAGSTFIELDYSWNHGKPWIRVKDNGSGMSDSELFNAMRYGSQSPLEKRAENDLGRFGLGLKTASFSQCKCLTVASKKKLKKKVFRCWDLDHVVKVNDWELFKQPYEDAIDLLKPLDELEHGTIVLWQNIDRLLGTDDLEDDEGHEAFNSKFSLIPRYIEMVFHRFLEGKNGIKISVGAHKCKAWDPYLKNNSQTQPQTMVSLEHGKIQLQAYILPHVSKRTEAETEEGGGIYGWNAHQGIYVYRNKRLIVPGGYLDFNIKPEEHYKLVRIQLDLPNNMDHEWLIDVRKHAASVPAHLRKAIEKDTKAARNIAVKVYRERAPRKLPRDIRPDSSSIWLKSRKNDKIIYTINKKSEAIKYLLDQASISKSLISKLFYIIENSLPHRGIIMDNSEIEDCHVDLPEDLNAPTTEMLKVYESYCREILIKNHGYKLHDAINATCLRFPPHPKVRAYLEEKIEEK